MTEPTGAPPCLMTAWQQHEHELYGWLLKQSGSPMDADDLLQETFLRAIRQQGKFCAIENARAWLFDVARHLVIDRSRRLRPLLPLSDELAMQQGEIDAVDSLAGCLPRVLEKLAQADRDILRHCDLEGMKQADYAARYGLTLAAAKSRLLRARDRLRQQLSLDCQVRLDSSGRVCCFTPAVK
ncbi:sigma-70 family RNA polymerase sigma factor [Aeromonas allosaccharophila]|uniref:sigma-70 family RNA polymerase sigma factor n=1 Tax=Aeromonas allosaccharophila TaxID=656 RepID=UPI001EF84A3A|nr:sigma-70 family RNA polymerase sigma factor [Aeromonas allosaccharophila]